MLLFPESIPFPFSQPHRSPCRAWRASAPLLLAALRPCPGTVSLGTGRPPESHGANSAFPKKGHAHTGLPWRCWWWWPSRRGDSCGMAGTPLAQPLVTLATRGARLGRGPPLAGWPPLGLLARRPRRAAEIDGALVAASSRRRTVFHAGLPYPQAAERPFVLQRKLSFGVKLLCWKPFPRLDWHYNSRAGE